MLKKIRSLVVVGGCVSAMLGVTTAPASAAMSSPAITFSVAKSGLYHVVSACHLAAGYTTDPRFITFVVRASADAEGPSVALATGVVCTVYSGGVTRGGASGGLVGPHVEAVGQAIVPIGQIPVVCVTGGATFLDGHTVDEAPCP